MKLTKKQVLVFQNISPDIEIRYVGNIAVWNIYRSVFHAPRKKAQLYEQGLIPFFVLAIESTLISEDNFKNYKEQIHENTTV